MSLRHHLGSSQSNFPPTLEFLLWGGRWAAQGTFPGSSQKTTQHLYFSKRREHPLLAQILRESQNGPIHHQQISGQWIRAAARDSCSHQEARKQAASLAALHGDKWSILDHTLTAWGPYSSSPLTAVSLSTALPAVNRCQEAEDPPSEKVKGSLTTVPAPTAPTSLGLIPREFQQSPASQEEEGWGENNAYFETGRETTFT